MNPLPETPEALLEELNQLHSRLFDLANHQAGNKHGNLALYLHEAANNVVRAKQCQARGNSPNEPIPLFALASAVGGMSNLEAIMAPRHNPLKVKEPVVSIDRASKTYAFFDGVEILQKFQPYTSEEDVIAEAQVFFRDVIDQLPRLVYPSITKIRATS